MAYSMFEQRSPKNLKQVQYFPQESDVQEKSDFSDTSYYYSSRQINKFKKILPEDNYMNERKCPIYVHEYAKNSSDSTYNNQSSKSLEKSSSSKSKSANSQSSKSMLDKLEETYWASWRPNRENNGRLVKKERTRKDDFYGNISNTVVKHFEKKNFKESSASVDDSNYKYHSRRAQSARLIEMNSQEIQTDDLLTFEQTNRQRDNTIQNLNSSETVEDVPENIETTDATKYADDNDTIPVKENQSEIEEVSIEVANSKLLEHKDSFIIHKKKQEEVKETFQQPKCIKLYKKPGSGYMRGGSYPLKPSLRNDVKPKGHFRLGPPGSPMFVTSSTYNRKYGK